MIFKIVAIRNNEVVVAIHQPQFFPWLGYFHKIYRSNVFVHHDIVKENKYTKRAYLRDYNVPSQLMPISIPLIKHSDSDPMNCLRIAFQPNKSKDFNKWANGIVEQVRSVYGQKKGGGSGEYYDEYKELFRALVYSAINFEYITDYNLFVTEQFLRILSIKVRTLRTSEMESLTGRKNELNISILKSVGATSYYSGIGGKAYQHEEEEKAFLDNGISLMYQDFLKWTYYQRQGDWIPGLSIIDALFNIGPEGILKFFEKIE